MTDLRRALEYLAKKRDRLTALQQNEVNTQILRALATRVSDIEWQEAVDYACKQAKTIYPAPMGATGPQRRRRKREEVAPSGR